MSEPGSIVEAMTSYTKSERERAALWKSTTATLPDQARLPGPYVRRKPGDPLYPFCLPTQFSRLNLLPEVRDTALAVFTELGIPWHAGVDHGPSTHLLSSQVQCANALAQMIADPERISRAFGSILELGEILEIEPGRHLTFEYIGPQDLLHEAGKTGVRTRGANCTSVDAAFCHQTTAGTELVLIEWKYTESYRRRTPVPKSDAVRRGRYEAFVKDPAGPIRSDMLPFDLLLDEPIYQLMRQQLLAWRLEQTGVADRVRVVEVAPPGNLAYEASIHTPRTKTVGATVSDVWTALLRHPQRFTKMNSATFLDPAITSTDYVARYGSSVVTTAP